jgi:hypothetical protein
MVGDWKQHELWDGTYSFADLVDWHEMNNNKNENRQRWDEYQKTLKE